MCDSEFTKDRVGDTITREKIRDESRSRHLCICVPEGLLPQKSSGEHVEMDEESLNTPGDAKISEKTKKKPPTEKPVLTTKKYNFHPALFPPR